MNISVCTAPYIDLVVHVVKVRRPADSRRQSRGPLVAIHASGRVSDAGLIQQGEVSVVGIGGGDRRAAIRFLAISRIVVVLVNAALRAVLCDRKAPVAVDPVL